MNGENLLESIIKHNLKDEDVEKAREMVEILNKSCGIVLKQLCNNSLPGFLSLYIPVFLILDWSCYGLYATLQANELQVS
jgi:hypothetical protein